MCVQAGPPEGGRYAEDYGRGLEYQDVGERVTFPPPCFLKVCDFNGDESVCFDRDLEVLMVRMLRSSRRSVLGVCKDATGGASEAGGTLKIEPGSRGWVLIGFEGRIALQVEFCFDQAMDYGEDDGGGDAEHEHSVGCFNGPQHSPPGG